MGLPDLRVKISKKLNTLTLEYGDSKLEVKITNGEINILEVDTWITDLLFDISDKAALRERLMGNDRSLPSK